MIGIREYVRRDGRSLFGEWFDGLHSEAARRVTTALYRLGLGNFSNVKGVGSGVFEYRIDFGPGYRVYFGKDGEQITVKIQDQTVSATVRDGRWLVRLKPMKAGGPPKPSPRARPRC